MNTTNETPRLYRFEDRRTVERQDEKVTSSVRRNYLPGHCLVLVVVVELGPRAVDEGVLLDDV